jgi:hypothetical protein
MSGCQYVFCTAASILSPPPFDEADLRKTSSLVDKMHRLRSFTNSVRYNIMNDASAENEYYSKIKIYDKKRAEEWLNVNIPVQTGESLGEI